MTDITYLTRQGDTFAKVSRQVYGDESYANVIRLANIAVFEPIIANIFLTIPLIPLAPPETYNSNAPDSIYNIPQPGRVSRVAANSPDEVTLLIDGVAFSYWESVTITTKVDSFSTVCFTAPFEPDDANIRNILKPLSFKLIQLFIGGEPYFFGRMLPVVPNLEPDKRTVEVGCYAYPATLNDCHIPVGQKPQFTDVNLFDIAIEICKPFAINIIEPELSDIFTTTSFNAIDEDNYSEPFPSVSIKPTTEIIKFLTKLANTRKLVITDNANGDLVFLKAIDSGVSVAHLQEGVSPMTRISPEMNTQDWYSDITGVQVFGYEIEQSEPYTVKNKFLQGVFRPYTVQVKDVNNSIKDAVDSKFARMIANVVKYKIDVIGWRDQSGRLWTKNTMIDVTAPSAMIYKKYQFLIKDVEFKVDANEQTTTLSLVLPGSFTGQLPENLPWGL